MLHYGFVTEKLMDAFYADTIPVYFGSTTASEIFNKDAFINVAEYPSFEAAIQKIIELDQDDEKYLQMLRQPVLVDPTYPARLEEELNAYIRHVFSQPPEKAYRRARKYIPGRCDEYLSRSIDSDTLTTANLAKRMAGKVRDKSLRLVARVKK